MSQVKRIEKYQELSKAGIPNVFIKLLVNETAEQARVRANTAAPSLLLSAGQIPGVPMVYGSLDAASTTEISGWAFGKYNYDQTMVDIYVNDAKVATVPANFNSRSDVINYYGITNNTNMLGFSWQIPSQYQNLANLIIGVKLINDNNHFRSSPGVVTGSLPTSTPAATLPPWISGLDYTFTNGILRIRSGTAVGRMKFEKPDGSTFSTTNPDQVTINSNTYYDFGPINPAVGVFNRQWNINWTAIPLRITVHKENELNVTYTVNFTPVVGATNQPLSGIASTPTTTSTPTPTTVSAGPGTMPVPAAPVNRSYNYPIIAPGIIDGFNSFNNSMSTGNPPRIVGEFAVMENSNTRIEIRRGYGGAVQLFDKISNKYVFNWYDWGRQSELCLYSGPKNFNENRGNEEFSSIGYNPIVPGSIRSVQSPIIASGFVTGNDNVLRHYTKIRMIQWASGNSTINPAVLTDAWLEKWVGLMPDGSIDVKTRSSFNRADQTFYDGDIAGEATGQEYPNMMVIGNQTNQYYYVGPTPYVNDNNPNWLKSPTSIESGNNTFEQGSFNISEPWLAVQYSPGRYSFMSTERLAQATTTVYNPEIGNSTNEFAPQATYTSNIVPLIMDPQGTWYHDYAFLLTGDIQTGRTWANNKSQRHGSIPNWNFTQANGRNDWRVGKGFDQREPFTDNNWKPSFRVREGNTRQGVLNSPPVIHIANQIPKIFIRMRYSGPITNWRLSFTRNGERDGRFLDSDKPNQMSARYPNGTNVGYNLGYNFNIINDGVMRTYEINTNTNSEWKDVIQGYKIEYNVSSGWPTTNDNMEISYFGSTNPGA